jgi:hypothetical protein
LLLGLVIRRFALLELDCLQLLQLRPKMCKLTIFSFYCNNTVLNFYSYSRDYNCFFYLFWHLIVYLLVYVTNYFTTIFQLAFFQSIKPSMWKTIAIPNPLRILGMVEELNIYVKPGLPIFDTSITDSLHLFIILKQSWLNPGTALFSNL